MMCHKQALKNFRRKGRGLGLDICRLTIKLYVLCEPGGRGLEEGGGGGGGGFG